MGRKKVVYLSDEVEVIYSEKRWRILEEKRALASRILEALEMYGIRGGMVYGSVARGDVSEDSDVDVVVPYLVNPALVEVSLESAGFEIFKKVLVQATPNHVPKLHIYLDDLTCVTVPLAELRPREYEFYKFGGAVTLDDILEGKRVSGVDKRLMFIEPTEKGHKEWSVLGREAEVAERLGISIDTVKERIYVLTKRDKVGRTGIYLKIELPKNASVEEILERLAKDEPGIRKRGFGILN